MSQFTRIFFTAIFAALPLAAVAQTTASENNKTPKVDIAVMYSALHTNAPVGGCNCFWMKGATAQVAIPIWRSFSLVGEAGGQTIGSVPDFGVGLNLFSGMGGLRYRLANHTLFQPFAQGLVGGMHGFSSYFPAPAGKKPTSYDSSFAMVLGGGLDLAVSKHVWIRAFETDYHYTQLRNMQGDRQNQFRVSGGVVARFPNWFWEKH